MWKFEEQVAPMELSFLKCFGATNRARLRRFFFAGGRLHTDFPIRPVVKAVINNRPRTTDNGLPSKEKLSGRATNRHSSVVLQN